MTDEPEITISCIEDLMELVGAWEELAHDGGRGYPYVWYRGQADASWDLLPGVERDAFQREATSGELRWDEDEVAQSLAMERTINQQFLQMGEALFPSGASSTEKYLLAQHHGLPTRLLDWTTNPMAALFFCLASCPDKDGALYATNPRFLLPNDLSDPRSLSFPVNEDSWELEDSIRDLFGLELRYPERMRSKPVIASITPKLRAGRMLQQGSCFTFHMPRAQRINEIIEPDGCKFHKCIVPREKKNELRQTLRRLGTTSATLFCDLDNLARELKDAWRITS